MNIEKLTEKKVIRDTIHGYINIEYKVIMDIIDTKEFQRLRRIRQLGGDFQVYPTAEHSRFTHCLGVYEIVRRMIFEIKSLSNEMNEYEKITLLLAGLLHDVGHGPFSHSFEHITNISHEEFTSRMILEDTDINKILKKVYYQLPNDVVSIINHTHKNKILNEIVSSQLDADRMDYLLRDSYASATSYGKFDLERILRTLRVRKDLFGKKHIVVKESGIHSVEDYIMARYQMYWQVYFHPAARSYETIFIQLFKRLKDIYQKNHEYFLDLPYIIPFLTNKKVKISDYFKLDESVIEYYSSLIKEKNDPIASDLASRLLDRKLFNYLDFTEDNLKRVKDFLKEKNLSEKYYLRIENVEKTPYMPFTGQKILVEMKNGEIIELQKASNIVDAIIRGNIKKEGTIFYPKI